MRVGSYSLYTELPSETGRADVAPYTHEAWANGFVQALGVAAPLPPQAGSVGR